jgi:hypothetical protein
VNQDVRTMVVFRWRRPTRWRSGAIVLLTFGALVAASTVSAGPAVLLPAVPITSSAGPPPSTALVAVDDALRRALAADGVEPLRFATDLPARAGAPEATALRQRADEAAANGDNDVAIRLYREAIDAHTRALAASGDVESLVDARLALATLYLGAGEAALARTELDAAARLRPAAELDPRAWSPVVIEAFDEARRRVAREPPAELTVRSTPSGADVVVDGVPRGPTPATVALPRGVHLLHLGRAGHEPRSQVVVLDAAGRVQRDETLTPRPAWTAWSNAQSTLRAPGTRAGDVAAIVALRRQLDADALWVPVVAATATGVAVVFARVVDDVEVVAVLGIDDVGAPAATALIAEVARRAHRTGPTTADAVVAAHTPAAGDPRDALRIDLRARAVGMADGVVVRDEDDASVFASPWTWVAVGVGGALVAGAATAAAVLLQPAPVEEREPDRTRVVVEVLP